MSSIAKGAAAAKSPVLTKVLSIAALAAIGVGAAEIQAPAAAQEDGSSAASPIEEVTVSARRREEAAQDVLTEQEQRVERVLVGVSTAVWIGIGALVVAWIV